MSDIPKVKYRNHDALIQAVADATGDVTASIAAKADELEAKRTAHHEKLAAERKLRMQSGQHA